MRYGGSAERRANQLTVMRNGVEGLYGLRKQAPTIISL